MKPSGYPPKSVWSLCWNPEFHLFRWTPGEKIFNSKPCRSWTPKQLRRSLKVFFFFPAIGLLGETRRHSGSFLIKRWYSVLCHFLQGTSHFSVLDIKWVSVTQVPSYLHSFMCPGEPWSSYSSFVHCSWYQWSSAKCCLMLRVFSGPSYNMPQQFDPFLLQHMAEWTYGVVSSCFGIRSSVNFFVCIFSVNVRWRFWTL